MDFRRALIIALGGTAFFAASARAADASCIGPTSAQLCTDAFGNQSVINRTTDTTRIQYSAINKLPDEEGNTAAMLTETGWQIEEMPPGTFVDPSLSDKLDRVSTPLMHVPAR